MAFDLTGKIIPATRPLTKNGVALRVEDILGLRRTWKTKRVSGSCWTGRDQGAVRRRHDDGPRSRSVTLTALISPWERRLMVNRRRHEQNVNTYPEGSSPSKYKSSFDRPVLRRSPSYQSDCPSLRRCLRYLSVSRLRSSKSSKEMDSK
jgi:hypothetical protein